MKKTTRHQRSLADPSFPCRMGNRVDIHHGGQNVPGLTSGGIHLRERLTQLLGCDRACLRADISKAVAGITAPLRKRFSMADLTRCGVGEIH